MIEVVKNMAYKFLKDKLVCILKEQIVGEVDFSVVNETLIEVHRVFVLPEFRGQKIVQGLMEQLCKFASANQKQIKPLCSYAQYWFAHNQTYTS